MCRFLLKIKLLLILMMIPCVSTYAEEQSVNVTIIKHGLNTNYNGEYVTVTGYDFISNDSSYVREDLKFIGTVEDTTVTGYSVGVYSMPFDSNSFENVNENFSNVNITVVEDSLVILPIEVNVRIIKHGMSVMYDGATHEVTGYDFECDNALYTRDDLFLQRDLMAKGTEVGKYGMSFDMNSFMNVNPNFSNVNITVVEDSLVILPIEVNVRIIKHGMSVMYDGTTHEVTGYDFEFDNELYRRDDLIFRGVQSDSTVVGIEAGIYGMSFDKNSFENINPNFSEVNITVVEDSLEIKPIAVDVTITKHGQVVVFDGNCHVVTGFDFYSSDPLYRRSDLSFSGDSILVGTGEGRYVMNFSESDFENTNFNFDSVRITIVEDSLVILPKESRDTVVYLPVVYACGSYIWDGMEYYESGLYESYYQREDGSDSIVHWDLRINQPIVVDTFIRAYDSYKWHGKVYTQSGEYSYVTDGSNGCDSITIMHLKVLTKDPIVRFYVGDSMVYEMKYNAGDTIDYSMVPEVKTEESKYFKRWIWIEDEDHYGSAPVVMPEEYVELSALLYDKPTLELRGYKDPYVVYCNIGDTIDLSVFPIPQSKTGVFAGWTISSYQVDLISPDKFVVRENSSNILVYARWASRVANVDVIGRSCSRYYTGEPIVVAGYRVESDNELFKESHLKLLTTDTISAVEIGSYTTNMKFVSTNELLDSVIINVIQSELTILEPDESATPGCDFSKITTSGQRLYFRITGENSVEVTYPAMKPGIAEPYPTDMSEFYSWEGYFKYIPEWSFNAAMMEGENPYYRTYEQPDGEVVIPSEVEYKGVKYTVKSIGDHAFAACSNMVAVEIPNTVEFISQAAFESTGLESLRLGPSIKVIAPWLCTDCKNLKEFELDAERIVFVGDGFLNQCTMLNTIIIKSTQPVDLCGSGYYNYVFQTSGDHTLIVPCGYEDVYRSISCYSYWEIEGGEVVRMPDGMEYSVCEDAGAIVRTINNSDTVLVIPAQIEWNGSSYNVTSVKNGALANSNVKRIVVSNIAQWVDISMSLKDDISGMEIYVGEKPLNDSALIGELLQNQPSPTKLILPADSLSYYKKSINALLHKDWWSEELEGLTIVKGYTSNTIPNKICMGCAALKELTIVSDVYVSAQAFENCTSLENVVIDDKVSYIGNLAFAGCSNLKSIVLPSGLSTIENRLFENCKNLVEVTIPSGVRSINDFAFSGCAKLNNLILPASVEEVSTGAFSGCSGLKIVTSLAILPPSAEDSKNYKTFSNYNAYLYVPCDNLEDYDLHQVWGNFKYIKCVAAEQVTDSVVEVVVEAGTHNAVISWPKVDNTATYTLTISKDNEVVCTLIFNSNGQLTTIDFSTVRSGSEGFQFNVTGLDENTLFNYTIEAKNKSSKVLETYEGEFKTLGNNIDESLITEVEENVYAEDGVIYVESGNNEVTIFNLQGQRLFSGLGSVSYEVPNTGVYVVKVGDSYRKVVVK